MIIQLLKLLGPTLQFVYIVKLTITSHNMEKNNTIVNINYVLDYFTNQPRMIAPM